MLASRRAMRRVKLLLYDRRASSILAPISKMAKAADAIKRDIATLRYCSAYIRNMRDSFTPLGSAKATRRRLYLEISFRRCFHAMIIGAEIRFKHAIRHVMHFLLGFSLL